MLQLTLDDSKSAELRQLARQAAGRVSERAHFVLLSGQGYSVPKISALMGYEVQTVRTWTGPTFRRGVEAYRAGGCPGLEDAPRSGRPLKDPHLTAVVQAQAGQPPPNFGYVQACWTVALLVWHLADRFRLLVSPGRVRQALRQADFVCPQAAQRFGSKRPKLAPARRRDPLAAEKEAIMATALADPAATLIADPSTDHWGR